MISAGVVAVVLAGGASSRFGSDKLAVSVDGRPLLHHALEAVALIADRIVIVIAPEAPLPPVPLALAGRAVFARDAAAHGGPLAGLSAALALDTPVPDEAPRITRPANVTGPTNVTEPTAGGRHEPLVLVVGGDMPALVPAVLRLLADTLAADASLAAMTLAASRPAPLPMVLRPDAARTAIDAILASGSRRSLMALIAAVPSATVPAETWRALDPGGASLRDIDTPTDLPG